MIEHKTRPTGIAARSRAGASIAVFAVLACGCAPFGTTGDADPAPLVKARDNYVTCVNAEAEKGAANPAGAEDIAVAAHGRCWAAWDAYRQATAASYADSARTREERQLAQDKADAHLRQFEQETRRGIVDGIVQRTFTKKP